MARARWKEVECSASKVASKAIGGTAPAVIDEPGIIRNGRKRKEPKRAKRAKPQNFTHFRFYRIIYNFVIKISVY